MTPALQAFWYLGVWSTLCNCKPQKTYKLFQAPEPPEKHKELSSEAYSGFKFIQSHAWNQILWVLQEGVPIMAFRALARSLRPICRHWRPHARWPIHASAWRGLSGLSGLPGAKTILEENVADSVLMVKPLEAVGVGLRLWIRRESFWSFCFVGIGVKVIIWHQYICQSALIVKKLVFQDLIRNLCAIKRPV